MPVEQAVFEGLIAPHPSERAAILTALACSVSNSPHPFVLAVDEAHQLNNAEGVEVLKTLAEHLPAGSQLAVAGRREPPLGLARLRSERRVLDIGIGDLRIDMPQARELLAAAGAQLTEPEVADLVSRTEGWPIGLYFAALAGNAHAFPRCRENAFDGDDRLLTDYLRSEFLAHLPPDRQRFLARSSVLDELSGPLCDATLDQTGSAAALEEMEASNLLLVPLDRQRRWYRYHHLFQRMLRHELERQEPAAIPVLARRASQWCEANGLLDSAIDYAQLAGDSPRVSHVLERTAMRQYALGRATTLRRWFEWLAGHGPAGGGAAVLGAWLSLLSGRAADAQRWAAAADQAPQDARMPDGSPLRAWVLTLHAAMARDVRQMRRDAARALQILSPGSQWRPIAASILGTAELFQGNLDTADQHLAETVELAADLGAPPAASLALATRAIIAIRQDRWQQAQTLAERASSVIQQAHLQDYGSSALACAVRSRVAAHLGDPWAARQEISAASRALPLLPLLATQLSFREIAGQLFISVHTVKAQVTSIYRKLAVSSRTQAIERARSLGLLPGLTRRISPSPAQPDGKLDESLLLRPPNEQAQRACCGQAEPSRTGCSVAALSRQGQAPDPRPSRRSGVTARRELPVLYMTLCGRLHPGL
jgi:LuxR family transcriptional regulator, maltose regulon positive regulatory protein